MGTYITPGHTKGQTVQEVLDDYKPVASKVVDNCLWMVIKHEQFTGIALALITDGGSGYKPMDECMGPFYYTCPLPFLGMVPDPKSGYSTSWRRKVVLTKLGRAWCCPANASDGLGHTPGCPLDVTVTA